MVVSGSDLLRSVFKLFSVCHSFLPPLEKVTRIVNAAATLQAEAAVFVLSAHQVNMLLLLLLQYVHSFEAFTFDPYKIKQPSVKPSRISSLKPALCVCGHLCDCVCVIHRLRLQFNVRQRQAAFYLVR